MCEVRVANTMSDSRLSRLLSIHAGGADKSDAHWRVVEQSLGLTLPGSYKTLVDFFGGSSWGDFLHVLSPFDDQLSLQRIGKEVLDADRVLRSQFHWHYPLALYPEPGGLLPWRLPTMGTLCIS